MLMKKEIKLNLATFDLVKGIALIGIVLGHMFSHYDTARAPGLVVFSLPLFLLRTAINPMFLIASGFGFRPKPMGKMLKKTASELLKPYGYVTLAVAILFPLVHFLFYRWWPGAVQEGMRYLLDQRRRSMQSLLRAQQLYPPHSLLHQDKNLRGCHCRQP